MEMPREQEISASEGVELTIAEIARLESALNRAKARKAERWWLYGGGAQKL